MDPHRLLQRNGHPLQNANSALLFQERLGAVHDEWPTATQNCGVHDIYLHSAWNEQALMQTPTLAGNLVEVRFRPEANLQE
jgi:hypothetical protein